MLRAARASDASTIAHIHARSWRAAYRGILPDRYLDEEADGERLTYWRAALASPDPASLVLVLEDRSGMLGFVAGRMPCEDGFDACIDNLHLQPQLRGGGLGRRLLSAAAEAFRARGAGNLFLWLFDGNAPAARFYARLGGVATDHDFDDFAGVRAPHTRIVFANLSSLAAACGAPAGTPGAQSG